MTTAKSSFTSILRIDDVSEMSRRTADVCTLLLLVCAVGGKWGAGTDSRVGDLVMAAGERWCPSKGRLWLGQEVVMGVVLQVVVRFLLMLVLQQLAVGSPM